MAISASEIVACGRTLCQEGAEQRSGAVEMFGHRVTCGACVAGEYGLHDRGVLLVRVHDIARQQGNRVEQIVDPHPCVGDRRRQATAIPTARRSRDAAASRPSGSRRAEPRSRRSATAAVVARSPARRLRRAALWAAPDSTASRNASASSRSWRACADGRSRLLRATGTESVTTNVPPLRPRRDSR